MMPPDNREFLKQWIEKAEHDFINAQHTLGIAENCPCDTVCFHAQQCVEKYLKALLHACRKDVPRSHDLTELRVLLPEKIQERFSVDMLAELNPYAVETRYPGLWAPIMREEAETVFQMASEIRSEARNALKEILPEEAL